MKTLFKKRFAVFLIITAISCTKESINKTSNSQLQANTKQALSFTIGQHYGGGIIFYIDNTGQHGLIADTVDLGAYPWANVPFDSIGTTSLRIGTGKSNTRSIISLQGKTGNYAALMCARLKRNGYNDWFLPSLHELHQLWLQKSVVGGFVNGGYYWSSSELVLADEFDLAWYVIFYIGRSNNAIGKGSELLVRAVRTF